MNTLPRVTVRLRAACTSYTSNTRAQIPSTSLHAVTFDYNQAFKLDVRQGTVNYILVLNFSIK